MKEYWVNVWKNPVCRRFNNHVPTYCGDDYESKDLAIKRNKLGYKMKNISHRLHVREFETREAKELYLKMKYGSNFGYVATYEHLQKFSYLKVFIPHVIRELTNEHD